MRPISGHAKLAGVIGWPVQHSLSPRLHGYWLSDLAIDGAYVPLAVAPERLESAIRGLSALGFVGANVTVPHKQAVMHLVDEVSDIAKRIGAVNTIVCRDDGSLLGDNTDAFGFITNIQESVPTWNASGAPACVLGAGGAARAVICSLLDAGVPEIRLTNRTRAKADGIADHLGSDVSVIPWDDRHAAADGAGLLVNTTSLGMTGKPLLDISVDRLADEAVVTDIVYAPLQTPLLAAAATAGFATVDGLGMLLHQARPGFEAWFGVRPNVTPALREYVLDGAS